MSYLEAFGHTSSIKLIESFHCATLTQVRFPRNHKRRIRKKWAKRPANWRMIPWPSLYQISDGTFVGHPITIKYLKTIMEP